MNVILSAVLAVLQLAGGAGVAGTSHAAFLQQLWAAAKRAASGRLMVVHNIGQGPRM
jgi:hypothetical protein